MPKEQITRGRTWKVRKDPKTGSDSGYGYHGEALEEGERLISDPHIEVNWGSRRAAVAQVSIHFEKRQWEACLEGQNERGAGDNDKYGIYADLEKEDIDRLIKVLKRVRRTAF
jgi:hypothetical protein